MGYMGVGLGRSVILFRSEVCCSYLPAKFSGNEIAGIGKK